VLDEAEFERVMSEICASGPPSSGDDLLGMEADVGEYLGGARAADSRPLPWKRVSVRQAKDVPWLIAAGARGARADAATIRTDLSRIWSQHLAYRYRQKYTMVVTPDQVCLQGITQIGPGDFWVTVEIQVALG
jgi:hypothetical protein